MCFINVAKMISETIIKSQLKRLSRLQELKPHLQVKPQTIVTVERVIFLGIHKTSCKCQMYAIQKGHIKLGDGEVYLVQNRI